MPPKQIQRLIELFTKFPGIGPRQASRFVFFLLRANGTFLSDLITALKDIGSVNFCAQCYRSTERATEGQLCSFCRDGKREKTLVAIVEKESDLQNLEKTSAFRGLYHVLGGLVSPLDSDSPRRLHLKELFMRTKEFLEKENSGEIILATNATAEGDTTALYIERILAPLKEQYPELKISRLGRGLSLGSELEYADEITLKNALTNRK